jgi:osmoprotectant transport system permease protein
MSPVADAPQRLVADAPQRLVADAPQRLVADAPQRLVADAPLWSGRQLEGNWDVIWFYTLQHLRYTVFAVVLGLVLAVPAGYLAMRFRAVYPVLLVVTNVIYAVPALTLFVILAPALGYTNDKPIVIAMALYSLVILVRNLVESIRSVPEPVIRAADGMGYRPLRRFVGVEVPLALPGLVAGLRLATISTVSLISVGAMIGRGALGRMFYDGYQRKINIEIWSALVAVIVLALVLDLVVYIVGRVATPWTRVRAARA